MILLLKGSPYPNTTIDEEAVLGWEAQLLDLTWRCVGGILFQEATVQNIGVRHPVNRDL